MNLINLAATSGGYPANPFTFAPSQQTQNIQESGVLVQNLFPTPNRPSINEALSNLFTANYNFNRPQYLSQSGINVGPTETSVQHFEINNVPSSQNEFNLKPNQVSGEQNEANRTPTWNQNGFSSKPIKVSGEHNSFIQNKPIVQEKPTSHRPIVESTESNIKEDVEIDLRQKPESLSDICGVSVSSTPLILEGVRAMRGSYPWHTAIFTRSETGIDFTCGGNLVTNKHVLTGNYFLLACI